MDLVQLAKAVHQCATTVAAHTGWPISWCKGLTIGQMCEVGSRVSTDYGQWGKA